MIDAQAIAEKCGKAHKHKDGEGWSCRCPAHADDNPSMTVTDDGDDRVLVCCHKGCSQDSVIAALKKKGWWPDAKSNGAGHKRRQIECAYPYRTADGQVAYEAVRWRPKSFSQRRPDPRRPGEWIWNMQGIKPLPYRLPESSSRRWRRAS
jgi:hypothetical protein